MHWVMLPFRRAFDYSGRSHRRECLSFLLVFWVAIPMTFAILYPAFQGFDPTAETSDWLPISVFLIMLALLVPTVPLLVRRFHDFNWSGWWLLSALVPIAGAMATIAFVWLPGNPGPNRFGPDPRESDSVLRAWTA